jgi:hypothetical protein
MIAMDWAFVAEDADAYQELPPSVERQALDDVVLVHAPSGDAWSNLAQAASRPILKRLGFQATGVMDVLVDHAAVRGQERSH